MHGRSSPIQVELLEQPLNANIIQTERNHLPEKDGIDTSN